MTPDDCAFLADLAAAHAGLRIDPGKPYLIESRLSALARRESFAGVAELARAVREGADERLRDAAVEALAPGESGFFRDRAVLLQLWRELVPELARRRGDQPVRIWSAGCASGQEIYSLAMLQAEEPAPTGKAQLFASDLSERQLERARAGLYSSFEVQRGLSARELVRHFENRDESFQLARRLRQQVRWRRVNLLEDLAPLGNFDVVLCRYVLSGFTEEARQSVLNALAGVVAPDGVLMLGVGEAAGPPIFSPHPSLGGVFVRAREVSAAA
jgi:chemotaxis protein methyltransferase CheR